MTGSLFSAGVSEKGVSKKRQFLKDSVSSADI